MSATSMNFASFLANFTPKVPGFPPITFKADAFFREEEFLSETQPDADAARYFPANDGNAGQYIDNFALSGKRDITIFDGPQADALMKMAYARPQPLFDLSTSYQRNDQDSSEGRTYLHTDCKFMNQPSRALSNGIAVIRFTFQYGKIAVLNAAGQPV